MIKILLSKKLGEVRMSQAELARRTGIRPNTINELYHEIAYGIKFEHLDKICSVLKCDVSELIVFLPESSKIKKRR